MPAELLIRPARNDHIVVRDLLTPGGGGGLRNGRPMISRLVVDAHLDPQRLAAIRDIAQKTGTPLLIDPLTMFLQRGVPDGDTWSRLPFAQATPLALDEAKADPDRLVASVVDFQLEQGATAVIPPYFYASSPDDPWFDVSLLMIRRSARYLGRQRAFGLLPIVPLFAGQLRAFTVDGSWTRGLGRFVEAAVNVGPQFLGLSFSPVGSGRESYETVSHLFAAARQVKDETGAPVIAWNQGLYSHALVAAGLDGYQTGIGQRESADHAAMMTARRRPRPARFVPNPSGVFISPIGRSLPQKAVERVMTENTAMRVKLGCIDPACCPSLRAMFDDKQKHAVRSRALALENLAAMPDPIWRLNDVQQKATDAVVVVDQINKVLATLGNRPLPIAGLRGLAAHAEFLRTNDARSLRIR